MPSPIHPHMLRHACGFKLANDGHDTRALQHYLGHKNIQHTVRYTEWHPTGSRTFRGIDDGQPHLGAIGALGVALCAWTLARHLLTCSARRTR